MFTNPHIHLAIPADSTAITTLLNSAYRGEESRKGWTTEADLIPGETRSNAGEIESLIWREDSAFLKYINDEQQLIGCVNLQQHGHKIYLGMFSVSPQLQGGGIGKAILGAAEEYALERRCTHIYMTVIALRKELVAWYMRHGYRDTGERKKLIEEEGTQRLELEMLVLEKELGG